MIQPQLKTVVAWFIDNPALAGAVIALLTGGVQVVRTYLRTGNLPLYTLPWRASRRVFYELRKRFFTTPWPGGKEIQSSVAELNTRLAESGYWVDWPLSYNYYSEDVNASRLYYDSSMDYPYRQLHIRAKEVGENKLELYAHEEAHPWFHPKPHLEGKEFFEATEWAYEQWQNNNFDPRGYER